VSLLASVALLLAGVSAPPPALYAQVVIEQRTVIRIRPLPIAPAQPAQRPRWKESKGPDCIKMNMLAGALVSGAENIDLLLRGGTRMRAQLEKSCSSIDFYQGFYVKPNKDGRICEDRDLIRSRVGGECAIRNFRILVPAK
jgi:hypothetical protein